MAAQEARGGTLTAGDHFAGSYVARLRGDRGSTIVSTENFMLFTCTNSRRSRGNCAS
jgi:hypothetical protein